MSDVESRGPAVFAAAITMICLSSTFVSLRMVSRAFVVKRLSWDDYFMIVAWVLAFGLCFSLCYATEYGLGRHEVGVPAEWQARLKEADYAFSILYQPALMASKTSILAFYLSLSKVDKVFRWACIITLVVVNAGGLSLTLVTVFQCTPISATFQSPIPASATCTDILTIYLASIPLNIISDVTLLLLPMPILTRMRLPRKQKIILLITFSFGIFVAAVDIVRISSLQNAAHNRLAQVQTTASGANPSVVVDASWYLSFSFMWSAVEVNVGIMCANVPGIKPLVARVLPSMLRDPSDSKSGIISQPANSGETNAVEIPSLTPPVDSYQPAPGRSPLLNEEPGSTVDMIDFLTTPDMSHFDPARLQTLHSNRTYPSQHEPQGARPFFDFVNIRNTKSLVRLSVKESVFPIGMVTVLFFIWGFEYGLLNTLNQQFQAVARITSGQSTALHSAYYAGYFAGPILLGRPILKHQGFKLCFPVGMAVYAAGLLIYWPAAVLTSWPTFIVTNFIVGFGLSLIEVAANPYVTLCGPPQYSTARLTFSQAVQAVGSVIAPLIAQKAFAPKKANASSLVDTQWAYLGIALATVFLAAIYFYTPLPEATDDELEEAVHDIRNTHTPEIHGIAAPWILLCLGVFSLFCYVGGQEVNSTDYSPYLSTASPDSIIADNLAIAHTAFAVSRFIAAGLTLIISPRILLLSYSLGAILFDILCMNFSSGDTGIALMAVVFFMEGPLFPLIYAQALHGMGRHTKFASVLLTSAIGGGAVFSPISSQLAINDNHVAYSLVVAVAVFASASLYPITLNLWPWARAFTKVNGDQTSPLLRCSGSLSSSFSSFGEQAGRKFGAFGVRKSHYHSTPAKYVERVPTR